MKIIDCLGLACPEPVIRCRKVLLEVRPEQLQVRVDNLAARENVSHFLRNNGYQVKNREEGEGWLIEGELVESPMLESCVAQEYAGNGMVAVLITSETLGKGDDELGRKLMENFLATLPEMGESLWKVILLNGGVKHAAMPGKALDSLQQLAQSGVEILVCGTCLSHYHLLEQKAVGQTTNMLDIVTSLALADRIITL